MRRVSVLAVVLAVSVGLAAEPRTITFTRADAGKLPAGWKADRTGTGNGSEWKVVADDTAPSKSGHALAQVAKGPSALFNLCVLDDTRFEDGDLAVAFKAIRGEIDQGGGVVWRYKNAKNYYFCRMNPLEQNYRVYKVVDGKRTTLATTKEDVKVADGAWHTIKVSVTGDRIECYLNGKKHLEAKDDTFKEPGKVGLWTKADAQTHFDNLVIPAK